MAFVGKEEEEEGRQTGRCWKERSNATGIPESFNLSTLRSVEVIPRLQLSGPSERPLR